MIAVLAFVGLATHIILVTIFKGYALTILWAWFIIPIFNLPSLNIVQAIGVSLTISLIHPHNIPKTDKDKPYEGIAYAWLLPIFAILIGWLVKQFM